jgi:lysozyme
MALSLLAAVCLVVSPAIGAPRPAPATDAAVAAAQEPSDPTPTPRPTPRPTPWPTPPGLKGLDVSHWNPDVDFERAADLGVRFVIAKASQGLSMRDDYFLIHTDEARAAGIEVGAYHFFDYRKDGRRQARHFLATVRKATGLGGLLPLVVDVETLSTLGVPNKARARARLHALLDELYRRTGRYPMIYTSKSMWERVVGAPRGFGAYPLWVACWKCDRVHMPRGWTSWRFWQFGQFRFGAGLPKLDGNVYSANIARLRGELQRSMRLDGDAEWTKASQVTADLRGYQGKEVRVALDGDGFGPWQPFDRSLDVELGDAQGPRAVRLQLRSFRNVRTTILRDTIQLDSVAPAVSGPRLTLEDAGRVPKTGKRIPVVAAMSARDRTSGLRRSILAASCGGEQRARAARPASGPDLAVMLDRAGCTVKASARDRVGHSASRTVSPNASVVDVRRSGGAVTFRGGRWVMERLGSAVAGTLARTDVRGASASLRFDGAQFAVVARRGPSGGELDVIVDGKKVGRVDLYAAEKDDRRIVFVGNVRRGSHTLKLRATGTADSRSSGRWVSLDAVLVLDRRR